MAGGLTGAQANQITMSEHEASRTLVKSAPELWAECSDAASLARHLGSFGEIRITKLDPETAVAWEGEDVRGTVTLEPSGWGTRVTLTAVAEPRAAAETAAPPAAVEEPVPVEEPVAVDEPSAVEAPVHLRGFWGRIRARLRGGRPQPETHITPPAEAEPQAQAVPPPEPRPRTLRDEPAALNEALDSLGRAHHRPYSRT
jgi:hypothetical protein